MPFRGAVLRGIRLAAILFAVFLSAMTVYRMGHATPVEDRQPLPAPGPSTAKPALAQSPSSGPAYPPPPPTPGAPVQIHRVVRERTPVQVEAVKLPVEAQQDISAVPAAEASEEQSSSIAGIEKDTPEVDSGGPPDLEPEAPPKPDPVGKPPNRGKRWMRAVGKFFHVGAKNDTPVEAVRQP